MDNLKSRASKGLLWDLIGNYGGQISSFVISIFLARILRPEEFGLMAMSIGFIGVLQIFKDFGLTTALIQNEKNTSLTYSSVFFVNVLAGFFITAVIYISAPLVGEFFENSLIIDLVRLLSITLLISSFNLVQTTILIKKFDFKSLTFRNLTAQLISGIIAIRLAYLGYGVYALVVQQLLSIVVSTILLWKITDWRPKWEFSWLELKKLSHFSIYVFAANSVNQIIQQLDALIIGKLFNPLTLGYFSRANSLNRLIIQNSSASISKVFLPTLSELKNDENRFEGVYLKVINIVATIAIFLTAIFYLIGEELIIGLFGEKWQASVPIFHILILKGFTLPISAMIVNAFMAKGKSKENFYFGNIRKVLQLIPFVFAYFGGFYSFLYANVGIAFLTWILNNLFAHVTLKVPLKDQFLAVIPNLFIAFIFVAGIIYIFPNQFSFIWVSIKAIVFIALFLTFLKLNKSPIIKESVEFFNSVMNKFKHNG